MDVDAFVLAHRPTWDRLEQLVKRRRRLTGAEVDELVDLYQRVSTHLSMVRIGVQRLGAGRQAVALGRAGPVGGHRRARAAVERVRPVLDGVVPGRRLPVVAVVAGARRSRSSSSRWSSACGWRATPRCRRRSEPPARSTIWSTTTSPTYYSENPAGVVRAAGVDQQLAGWRPQCIGFAVLLGIPIPYVLFQNAANLGVIGGLMFDAGKGDVFLGLLTPHGLLELTAVFLAGRGGHAAGLVGRSRPGDRPRGQVLAEQGRAVVSVAVGLVVVLLVVRADRGARHAVAAADLRADRDRRRWPKSASWPT